VKQPRYWYSIDPRTQPRQAEFFSFMLDVSPLHNDWTRELFYRMVREIRADAWQRGCMDTLLQGIDDRTFEEHLARNPYTITAVVDIADFMEQSG